MSNISFFYIKEYFHARKVLKKNETIFFPDNRFLYGILILLPCVGCSVASWWIMGNHSLLSLINTFIDVIYLFFLSDLRLWLIYIPLTFLLYLVLSANQVEIHEGFLILRTYFILENKIKIEEIKDVKITHGRQNGQASVNLMIKGKKRKQVININMVAYPRAEIKKICELIGYPDIIKELTPEGIKNKRKRQIKTIRFCLNVILSCLLLLFCSGMIMFIIRKILFINDKSTINMMSDILVPVSIVVGLRISNFMNKKTRKKSFLWLIIACIISLSIFLGLMWLLNK